MEVTIKKYGLYRNKVTRLHIPGLKSGPYDDQTQGWWLPFKDYKGDWWLVDTYHISSNLFNYLDPLTSFVNFVESHKDGTYIIQKANNDYYYDGAIKVSAQLLKDCFELICDLREFTISKCNPNEYDDKDVVTHVQFYFEHAYGSTGVTLLRKGAEKEDTRVAETLRLEITNQNFSFISDSQIEQLKGYAVDVKVQEKERLRCNAAVSYLVKMKELKEKELEIKKKYREAIYEIERRDEEC